MEKEKGILRKRRRRKEKEEDEEESSGRDVGKGIKSMLKQESG